MASTFHYNSFTVPEIFTGPTHYPYERFPTSTNSSAPQQNARSYNPSLTFVTAITPQHHLRQLQNAARSTYQDAANFPYDSLSTSSTRLMPTSVPYKMSAISNATPCASRCATLLPANTPHQMTGVSHETPVPARLPYGRRPDTAMSSHQKTPHMPSNTSTVPYVYPEPSTSDDMSNRQLIYQSPYSKSDRPKTEIFPLPPPSLLPPEPTTPGPTHSPFQTFAVTFRNTTDRQFHFVIKNALRWPWRHLMDEREVLFELGPMQSTVYRVEVPFSPPSEDPEGVPPLIHTTATIQIERDDGIDELSFATMIDFEDKRFGRGDHAYAELCPSKEARSWAWLVWFAKRPIEVYEDQILIKRY